LPFSILKTEVHGLLRLLWAPERRIGYTLLSWGLSRNATLTLQRMVGPGSPPDVGGPSHFR